MNAVITDEEFKKLHEPHWVVRGAFQLLVFALLGTEVLLAFTVYRGWIWAAVLLVLVTSHLMHGTLIGLHEAAHGLLRKDRGFNEFDGVVIGVLSLMSFSLYRVVHQTHHAYLTTERDQEFWPLSQPTVPRRQRQLAAFLELNFGLFFSPFIFLRAFLRSPSSVRSKRIRRRVWAELGLTVVVWALILSAVAVFGLWKYFLWLYLAPAFIAANLQSWRKYIEHVGMTGDTVNGSTRSIVANTWMGRLVSFTLLHEPFHGVHHQKAGLPHAELPLHVDKLQPKNPGELPPFPSYRHAFIDLMHKLADPRVGPQWQAIESAS
ncbi:MAG TPA: fatty acid desaturase [Chthoniobacterales bacterium]|jgi:fatty acid desaturase|nr:fatty acid desaturase [Chthoniobacterales bacterium]